VNLQTAPDIFSADDCTSPESIPTNDWDHLPADPCAISGAGRLEVTRVNGASVVTCARANAPLKLLAPKSRSGSAWVFTSTYGGGLVAGDTIALDVALGESATCLLGTQASTKIYRSPAEVPCRQTLNVIVGAGATCIAAPHPVTCFKQARFVQRQRFDLASGSSLVLVDWLTSGRHASGERWEFDLYDSRTDIFVEGCHAFRDALRLTDADGPIAAFHRTGRFDCFAYAVVLGERLRERSAEILRFVGGRPISHEATSLLFSASPFDSGVVLRAAGTNAEVVAQWLRQQLSFVSELLAEDPWKRLW
jgi:urease accessory protein